MWWSILILKPFFIRQLRCGKPVTVFDPTVGSLANAYGFGPQRPLSILGASQRDSLLSLTGWDKINLTQDHRIEKKSKGIQMDFQCHSQRLYGGCHWFSFNPGRLC